MTVYEVTNPNAAEIAVEHAIVGSDGSRYVFWSHVPANSAARYRVRDMEGVPSPFQGTLTLSSDHPFEARIVGYDYPNP